MVVAVMAAVAVLVVAWRNGRIKVQVPQVFPAAVLWQPGLAACAPFTKRIAVLALLALLSLPWPLLLSLNKSCGRLPQPVASFEVPSSYVSVQLYGVVGDKVQESRRPNT